MRILMVVTEFPAISETFVLDQITGLIGQGHKVDVLALQARDDNMTHNQVQDYRLEQNIYYAYQGKRSDRKSFLIRNGIVSILRGNFRLILGTIYYAIRKRAKSRTFLLNPVHFFVYGSKLLEIPRPDVAICHFGPNGDLMVRLRAILRLDFPIATFFHGHDLSEILALRGERVYDLVFKKGDLFFPVSDFFLQRLLRLGSPVHRTIVQRMGVNLKLFPPPAERQLEGRAKSFRLLSIGRMVEKKGHADAIRAFASCKSHYPDVEMHLTVIGDGPLRQELEMLIAQKEVGAWVHLVGALPRDEVRQYLTSCDAFILPSVTSSAGDMEGFPVSILEAMAMECAILSTVHSGIPELVDNGVNGFLVEERNYEALALAMAKLVEDRALTKKMGRAGRAKIVAEMSLDCWNEKLSIRLEALRQRWLTKTLGPTSR